MRTKPAVALMMLLALAIVSGCTQPAGSDLTGEPTRLLFSDDFTSYEVGEAPATWGQWNLGAGEVEIVEDSGLESGLALRIADVPSDERYIVVEGAPWTPTPVKAVMIDFKVKWVDGSGGLTIYLNDGSHRMNMILNAGRLVWWVPDNERTIGQLKDGWNHVRIVAGINTQSAHVYLNDMEKPALRGVPFRHQVDSWHDMRFLIRLDTSANETREVLFGEFEVWTLEQVDA